MTIFRSAKLSTVVLLLVAGLPGVAQPWLEFVRNPILSEDDRRSMMFSYVDRHLPPIELPATRQSWEHSRDALRRRVLKSIGLEDLETRGPVRWVGKGRIERETYTIEKILFESYPGMMVPALVYVPKALKSAAPAMVSISGHVYCEGKASDSVQARSVNLAQRGIIVLTYDYIDTGERNTGANACASMPYGGGNDHGLKEFSYTAGTPTGLEILDGVRAVDYLYTRPDVDHARLGFTGESGGSNSTYWISALDERVRLAVPVCSVTTFDYWIRQDRNWDWHQRPAGIRQVADIPTLLALIAPRPLLVIGSLRGTDSEEFPFDQMEEAVRRAKHVYELYGAASNIVIWESTTAHGYQQDKRERMYGFVEEHLLGRGKSESRETAFLLEPQHELDCGIPTGNNTLKKIYSEWLGRPTPSPVVPHNRETAEGIQARLRRDLRTLLGLDDTQRVRPRIRVEAVTSRGEFSIRRLLIQPEDGIQLPTVEIQSRAAEPAGLVIVPGKSGQPAEAISAFAAAGLIVVLIDLRGTGEIQSGGRRTDNWAWFMGRPWTGMWVADIEATTEALLNEHPGVHVGILGTGEFAKPVMFAAGLDTRIAASAVRLEKPSYRDDASAGEISSVPGILAVADLPEIATLSAPRPCRIEYPLALAERFHTAFERPVDFAKRGFGLPTTELEAADRPDWSLLASWLARNLR